MTSHAHDDAHTALVLHGRGNTEHRAAWADLVAGLEQR